MKKSATKKVILLMIAIVSVLMVAQIAQAASIAGSKHDLSVGGASKAFGTGGSGNTGTDVCVYCHTPHNALGSGTTSPAPLWNHATTTASFTLYTSNTLNATLAQPTGVSKACLSCHDGSVAADSYAALTGTNKITSSSSALLGTDLSNDHPISFDYAAAKALDSGLVSPTSTSLVVTGIPLYGGKMECASCHSVHDSANGHFLRSTNAQSALCLKCHIK